MNFKPKLLACDLDGTLAESKQPVSLEMGELLGELLTHMPIAVMSGAGFMQYEAQLLPAIPENAHFEKLFLFPTNAAECYIYKDKKWKAHYSHVLNTFERGRIMQALKEALEETAFNAHITRPASWGEQLEDRGAQISFSALGQHAPTEAKTAFDPSGEKRRRLRNALAKRLPDFEIRLNATTSIEITKKGIHKAYGIRQLLSLADVAVSEILYVSDALDEGSNDSGVGDTGVHIHQVFGPEETAALIKEILKRIK
jgi:HAD superfamily hydrolase (TIGR01484 family)